MLVPACQVAIPNIDASALLIFTAESAPNAQDWTPITNAVLLQRASKTQTASKLELLQSVHGPRWEKVQAGISCPICNCKQSFVSAGATVNTAAQVHKYAKWTCHVMLCHAGPNVLCCAVLCFAVLCCAVLCCAVLCCAVLCCAVLCCAVPVNVML